MNHAINKFFLWIALLPSSFYKKLGIDLFHLKSVLSYKLMMDDRRPVGMVRTNPQKIKDDATASTIFNIIISLILGAGFLSAFFHFGDDVTRLTIYLTFFAFTLTMFLIIDFTHVLIDVKDNSIILPKPINPATFLAARLIHIAIYVFRIVIPLSLPGVIVIGFLKDVWASCVLVATLALLILFIFFVVNLAYLIIVKLFTPERFNSIIASIQIGFAIILFASWQLLPRLLDEAVLNEIEIGHTIWVWFFPPFWFASAWKFFHTGIADPSLIAGVVLSVVTSVLSIWLVVKYFAPAFHRKLSLIGTNVFHEDSRSESQKKHMTSDSPLLSFLSRIFTSAGVERGAFLFTWKMTGRNRDFKMKVYPQIGYMFVFVVLISFRHVKEYFFSEHHEVNDFKFPLLSLIYLNCLIFLGAIFQFPYSDRFKAAWLFFVSPIKTPGAVILGTVKAGLVKFVLPVMILTALLVSFFSGPRIIPNLFFGFVNVVFLCSIVATSVMNRLPFSAAPIDSDGQNTTRMILTFFLLAVFSIPHYFLFDYLWIIAIGTLVSLTGTWITLRSMKKTTWNKVNSIEA